MIVSIHQPHFLPWSGYVNKVLNSDVFVWLHNVQYRKNYFQNRTKIKNPFTDAEAWFTVPVTTSLSSRIDQVMVANNTWHVKSVKTLEQFYKKSPFFNTYFEQLSATFSASDNLDRINHHSFKYLLEVLGYKGRFVRIEDLDVQTDDPNDRLIEICRLLEAKKYIAGKGGHNYLDLERWSSAGIEVIWQEFSPAAFTYAQLGNSFIPGLSIVDSLFNIGAEQTRTQLMATWKVPS